MGEILLFPQKNLKRGPRGKIIFRVGQCWINWHTKKEWIIRRVSKLNEWGRRRVEISLKYHPEIRKSLAEYSFRGQYTEKSEYPREQNELREHLQRDLDSMGADDGWYSFFAITCTPPSQRGNLSVVTPAKFGGPPRKDERWKCKATGSLITIDAVTRDEGMWLFVTWNTGGFGSMKYERANFHTRYEKVG